MELRTVSMDDLPLWERLQCDPAMMAELGGAHPKEKMPQILRNALSFVENGTGWLFKVMVGDDPLEAAGSICIWESEFGGESVNEIGWMILREFQGRGYGTQAARAILDMARSTGRWDVVHAFTGATNGASNAICRKAGFTQLEECEIDYAGRMLHCNHWRIDLREQRPTDYSPSRTADGL